MSHNPDNTTKVVLYLSNEMYEKVKRVAKGKELTAQALMRMFIAEGAERAVAYAVKLQLSNNTMKEIK